MAEYRDFPLAVLEPAIGIFPFGLADFFIKIPWHLKIRMILQLEYIFAIIIIKFVIIREEDDGWLVDVISLREI